MLKQFIIGVLSSATAHRLFRPSTNNGKSRGGGCLLRLLAILIFIGLLCWALGYGLVSVTTGIPLSLYAGLKFLATNVFTALDKLFYPGFDVPAAAVWGFWGLVGGAAIQGYREMQTHGRKRQGLLVALTPLLLLGLINTVKGINAPEDASYLTPLQQEEQTTTQPAQKPVEIKTTKQPTTDIKQKSTTTRTKPATTTTRQATTDTKNESSTRRPPLRSTKRQGSASSLPVESTEPKHVPPQQNKVTTPTVATKPSLPKPPVNMVLIPAGEFQMGSNKSDDEKPVHTVYIDAFYMDKYEVTNAQYKAFLLANPQWQKGRISSKYHDGDYLKHWNDNNYPNGKALHPVTFVSWYGAMAYAKWKGKRLPTEAEWEKAARGNLDAKEYPWGDSISSARANYNEDIRGTTYVGKYPSNGYGLYDMAGNVAEWCLDLYDADSYGSASRRNPLTGGTISSITTDSSKVITSRVLRGGSWSVLPQAVRVADRAKGDPRLSYMGFGFRCVQSAVPTMTKTSTTTDKKTTTHRTPVRTMTDTPKAVPKAHIQKVWVDHNQYQDSVKGMRIHVKFDVDNFKDTKGRVVAYFYTKNGNPLKDTNGSYKTTTGDVSAVSHIFQPSYVNTVYQDFKFFMPYQELHMARGKYNLKFYIRIFSGTWNALSDKSDWVHFTYSR